MELACTCGDLPAHSHVYAPKQVGKRIIMTEDPFDVRIWVDWKAVARPEVGACGDPECYVLHSDRANPIHPPFYVDSRRA